MGNKIQCVFVCLCAFVGVFIVPFAYFNNYPWKYTQGLHPTAYNTLMSLKRFFFSLKEDVEYRHLEMSACPDLPAPDVSLYKNQWQPVSNSGQIFLYSAFIVDDKIRLIALRQRTVDDLTCQIWCRNTTSNTVFVDIHASRMEGRISGSDKPHSFTTTNVICPLSCSGVPYAVSIAEGNLTCRNAQNSFLLQKSGKVEQGMFSVCVPPVHGVYPTPYHLIQWIETNRLLGVKFFTFYNVSITPNSVLSKVYEKYSKEQLIEMLQWKLPIRDAHYFGQIASMYDCLYRNSKRFKYTGFFDLDELIIPRIPEDITWFDMLKRLPDGCSYSFRNSFFKGNDRKISSDELNREFIFNHSYVVRGVKRQNYIYEHGKRSKVIVKPEEIEMFQMHSIWSCTNGKVIRNVDPDIGMLHHYRPIRNRTDISDNTTLKYMTALRKQLKNSPIL